MMAATAMVNFTGSSYMYQACTEFNMATILNFH